MHLLKRVQGVLFSFFLAASLLTPALGQSATQASETLTVTVTDKKHNPVNDLKTGNFKVYDNDQPQQITSFGQPDAPACIGLLVDSSGSMRQQRSAVVLALMEMVRAGNPKDKIFVVNFNDQPYLDTEFTNDLSRIAEGLNHSQARGGTALYDTIIASVDHLNYGVGCEAGVLVVVTDGEDNESQKGLHQAIEAVQDPGGPVIYAIDLETDAAANHGPRGRHALEQIVTPTGGELFVIGNTKDLSKVVLKVAEEIRNQYSITYIPTDPQRNGTYHKIRVEVTMPGAKDRRVRVRAGYFARPLSAATRASGDAAGQGVTGQNQASPTDAPGLDGPAANCISGTVLDEDKRPVPAMTVELLPSSPGMKSGRRLLKSDADGKFKAINLEPGLYRIATEKRADGYPRSSVPLYGEGRTPVVTQPASPPCGNLVISAGPRAAHLKLKVLDATTHQPLPYFRVAMRRSTPGSTWYVEQSGPKRDVLVPPQTDVTVQVHSDGRDDSDLIPVTAMPVNGYREIAIELKPSNVFFKNNLVK